MAKARLRGGAQHIHHFSSPVTKRKKRLLIGMSSTCNDVLAHIVDLSLHARDAVRLTLTKAKERRCIDLKGQRTQMHCCCHRQENERERSHHRRPERIHHSGGRTPLQEQSLFRPPRAPASSCFAPPPLLPRNPTLRKHGFRVAPSKHPS